MPSGTAMLYAWKVWLKPPMLAAALDPHWRHLGAGDMPTLGLSGKAMHAIHCAFVSIVPPASHELCSSHHILVALSLSLLLQLLLQLLLSIRTSELP